MLPALQARFDRFERRREQFVADLRTYPADALHARPSPTSWSRADVAQHLVLVEEGTLLFVTKKPPRPPSDRTMSQRLRARLLPVVLPFPFRIRAPTPAVLPADGVPLEETLARWAAARVGLAAYLEQVDAPNLRALVFKHPLTGPMTVTEMMDFLVAHLEHHGHQMRRLGRKRT